MDKQHNVVGSAPAEVEAPQIPEVAQTIMALAKYAGAEILDPEYRAIVFRAMVEKTYSL